MNIKVNKNISVRKFIIITVFSVVLGLVVLYVAIKGFLNSNILKIGNIVNAEITYSEIVDISEDNKENYQRKIRYSYVVNNKQYTGEYVLWWKFTNSDKGVNVGDNIDIFYNI